MLHQDPDRVLQKIQSNLFKHPAAAPFVEPVNPELHGCPDYFSVIKEPMDLSLIQTKLDDGTSF
jgi:Bromodomain